MAVNLETLVLELKANNKQFKNDIEKAVSEAKKDFKELENININGNKDLSVNVDHSTLTTLNEHLDEKKKHLTSVKKHFDKNPIKAKYEIEYGEHGKTKSGSSSSGSKSNKEIKQAIEQQSNLIKQGFQTQNEAIQNLNQAIQQGFQNQNNAIKEQSNLIKQGFQTQTQVLKQAINKQNQAIQQKIAIQNNIIKETINSQNNVIKEAINNQSDLIQQGFEQQNNSIKEGFKQNAQITQENFQNQNSLIKQGFKAEGKLIKQSFQKQNQSINQGFQKQNQLTQENFQNQNSLIKQSTTKQIAKIDTVAKSQNETLKQSFQKQNAKIEHQTASIKQNDKQRDSLIQKNTRERKKDFSNQTTKINSQLVPLRKSLDDKFWRNLTTTLKNITFKSKEDKSVLGEIKTGFLEGIGNPLGFAAGRGVERGIQSESGINIESIANKIFTSYYNQTRNLLKPIFDDVRGYFKDLYEDLYIGFNREFLDKIELTGDISTAVEKGLESGFKDVGKTMEKHFQSVSDFSSVRKGISNWLNNLVGVKEFKDINNIIQQDQKQEPLSNIELLQGIRELQMLMGSSNSFHMEDMISQASKSAGKIASPEFVKSVRDRARKKYSIPQALQRAEELFGNYENKSTEDKIQDIKDPFVLEDVVFKNGPNQDLFKNLEATLDTSNISLASNNAKENAPYAQQQPQPQFYHPVNSPFGNAPRVTKKETFQPDPLPSDKEISDIIFAAAKQSAGKNDANIKRVDKQLAPPNPILEGEQLDKALGRLRLAFAKDKSAKQRKDKKGITERHTPELVTESASELVMSFGGFSPRWQFPKSDSARRISMDAMTRWRTNEGVVGKNVRNPDSDALSSNGERSFPIEKIISNEEGLRAYATAKPLLRGYSKDSIEGAAQAIAAKKKNPDIKIKLVGESGGGFIASEVTEILNELGYGDSVQGVGLGTPKANLRETPSNVKQFLSPHEDLGRRIADHTGRANLGKNAITDTDDPNQNVKAIKHHQYEFYLKDREGAVQGAIQEKPLSKNEIKTALDKLEEKVAEQDRKSTDELTELENVEEINQNSKELKKYQERLDEIKKTGTSTKELDTQIEQLEKQQGNIIGNGEKFKHTLIEFARDIENMKLGLEKADSTTDPSLDKEIENAKKLSAKLKKYHKGLNALLNADLKLTERARDEILAYEELVDDTEKKLNPAVKKATKRSKQEKIQSIEGEERASYLVELPDLEKISQAVSPIPNENESQNETWETEDKEELRKSLKGREYTAKGLKQFAKENLDFETSEINKLKKSDLVDKIIDEKQIDEIIRELKNVGDAVRAKRYKRGDQPNKEKLKDDSEVLIAKNLGENAKAIDKAINKYIKEKERGDYTEKDAENIAKKLINSLNNHIREISNIQKHYDLNKDAKKALGGYKGYFQGRLNQLGGNVEQKPINIDSKDTTNEKETEPVKIQKRDDFVDHPAIRKNWNITEEHIRYILDRLVEQSRKAGKDIQTNISEGSPGITRNIRKFWSITAKDISDKMKYLSDISKKTGSNISGHFKNGFENVTKNIPQKQKTIGNAKGSPIKSIESLGFDKNISLNIKSYWKNTKEYIENSLKDLKDNANKQGYKIQKSLSEGSDGITYRIRNFWKNTTKDLESKIESIKRSASKAGSGIQNSFENATETVKGLENKISETSASLKEMNTKDIANNLKNNPNEELEAESIKDKLKNINIVEFISNTFIATQVLDFFDNFTANLIDFSKASIRAFNKFESLKSGLSFAFAKDADKMISNISDTVNELGLNFNVVADSYKEFGAAVKGTKLSSEVGEIIEGFQTASAALGLNKEKQKSVFTAVSQMASKGVVSAEELRQQLGEHLPIAIQASARAMGVSITKFNKMLESGNILAEDLLPKLAKQLKLETQDEAKKKAKTFRASLNRLGNEISTLQVNFGQVVSKGLKPFVDLFTDALNLITEKKGVFISLFAGSAIGATAILADRFKLVYDSIKAVTQILPKMDVENALKKVGKTAKSVGRSLLKFSGITAGVATAGITLVTIYKQLNAHQTKFDEYTKNSIQSLNEFRKELGKTNNTELDISKQFKLGDTRDIFDSAINFMNKIDKKANKQIAKITPFSEEQLNTDLKTNAQAKAEHIQIDTTESLNATSKLIDDYANQINNDEEMDKMISALQSNTKKQQQVEAALIRNEGNTKKEEELLDKQKDLVKEREKIINEFVPGGEEELDKQIKQLKKQISLMKELNGQKLGGGKEFELDNQIERANAQLEKMQNLSDNFATKMELAGREVKNIKKSFQDINAEMQNKKFNLDVAIPQAKKKVNEQFLAGNINEKEREQILEKIEIKHQDKRLQMLQQYQKEYRKTFKDLNEAERAQIKNILDGKSLKDAQIGTIEKGLEISKDKDVSKNVITALKKRAEMIKRSKEIDNLQLEISEKQVEQHKEAKENQKELKDKKEKLKNNQKELKNKIEKFKDKVEQFQKEQKDIVKEHNNLTEDFRKKLKDFYKSTNKNLIKASKKLKETKRQNKKLEINNSLKEINGNVSDLFKDFSNIVSKTILNQKKFQTNKEQKELTRLEAEEKTAEIAQKIKDFQNERSEIVKRGNELRKKYLENEAKFEKTKVEHQNTVSKLQIKIQNQIQEIGKGFNSVAHGIATEGNKILSALSQLGNNLNKNTNVSQSGSVSGSVKNVSDMGEALFEAIIGKESSGNYKAVNPDTGALGLGQVMPSNVKQWTKEALGQSLSPEQFLNDKQAQIKTITNKLAQYYSEALEESAGNEKEAIRRIASKWYSGQSDLFNANTDKGKYPSIKEYTLDILDRVKEYAGNSIGKSINQATENVTFPVPGRNANENLPGAGGMMDATRYRGSGPEKHNGIDYVYDTGTPLQAPISGKISSVYSDRGEYGMRIQGKDEQGRNVEIALNHLSKIAQDIKQGQQIQAGQDIGAVGGDKGSWGSSGAHLDLKVKINGQYVDPRDFFGNKSSEINVKANQQNNSQRSTPDYKPIKINENIPEFEEINLPDLSGLGNIQQEKTEAIQAQSEEDIRKLELEERKEQLEIENKRHSLQNKIKDSIRESQQAITESRKETENILRENQIALSNEEKLLEKREEIKSNFEDAIRSRKNEVLELQRTLETEKERIEILKKEIELMEDGEEKQKNMKQLNLLKQSMQTREKQLSSLKEEINLLESKKSEAIKQNINLKRKELELDRKKYTSGIQKNLIDSQVEILSAENKNTYKKAELQAESSLMQERLRHSEKILEIEQKIKDQQERQKLIELENQTHENKLQKIRAEKQEKIEQANKKKQDLKTKYKTNLIDTQASTLEYSPYKQAELEKKSKIIQHKADTQQKKEDLEEQIKLLNLNEKEAKKLRTQFKKINQIKLNRIKQESNLLLNQVKDITKKGFSNLFKSFGKVIQGSKSMGEAFRGFAKTVLQSIAKIATKNLTNAVMGGIFGGGAVSGGIGGAGGGIGGFIGNAISSIFNNGGEVENFARGGKVNKAFGDSFSQIEDYLDSENIDEIRNTAKGKFNNFAAGGPIDSDSFQSKISDTKEYLGSDNLKIENMATGGLIEALKKEKREGGRHPVPIVASAGEQILSEKNGDAQFFRNLQKKGIWAKLKETPNQKINNFNNGGIVDSGFNNNLQRKITNQKINNFSNGKIVDSGFNNNLQGKMTWAENPAVKTFNSSEKLSKRENNNISENKSINISSPITVISPTPEKYRKTQSQIAKEQENQTKRAYRRFS